MSDIKVQIGPTQFEHCWKVQMVRGEQFCDLYLHTVSGEFHAREEARIRIAEFMRCEIEEVEELLVE